MVAETQTPTGVAQPERQPQPTRPEAKEVVEVVVPRISEQLAAQIALGNFKKDAPPQEIQDQVSKQPPTEVSKDTYKALQAQHDMRRDQDAEASFKRLQEMYKKLPPEMQRGKQDPTKMSEKQRFNELMTDWVVGEDMNLRMDLKVALREGPEKLNLFVNVMEEKFGFVLEQNPPPHFAQLDKVLFDNHTNTTGTFYDEFCRGDTNKALAAKLKPEEMLAAKGFLVRLLGSTDAFDALVALRQTQDRLQANQPLSPAAAGNQIKQGEDKILDFYQRGLDKANNKAPAKAKPANPPSSQDAAKPSTETTPRISLSPENQRKVDEAKQEIFDKAGKRTETEAMALIKNVEKQLEDERQKGQGKIQGATIQEIAQSQFGNEEIHDGHVVFIPKQDGDLFVIGDLHGDFTTLKEAMDSQKIIEQLESNSNTHVVFQGDLVDRGRKQVEVMDAILALKQRYGERITIIKADHEVGEGENVSSHDFPIYIARRYATQNSLQRYLDQQSQKLVDDMNNPNSDYAKRLEYRKKKTDQEQQETTKKIIEVTKKKLDGTPLTKEDRQFQIDFPEAMYMIQDVLYKAAKDSPLYKEYQQLYSLLPRMVVTANEMAISHGGPPGVPYNLQQLAVIISQNKEYSQQVFDRQMTWADPLKGDSTSHEQRKQQVIQNLQSLLQGDTISQQLTFEGKPYSRGTLETLLNKVKSYPEGIFPNSSRVEGGDYLDAIYANFILYNEVGLTRSRQKIGASVWVRAHEEVPDGKNIFWNGQVATLHTTGKGSPDSFYNQPRVIGKFNLKEDIRKIEESNIVRL